MHHAEPAEVAVFRAEGPVDNAHLLHQLRSQALQRAEIPLAVRLRALILLDVVDKDLEAAVDAAMIEIETKPADLERLSPTFMLPGVNASVQRFQ